MPTAERLLKQKAAKLTPEEKLNLIKSLKKHQLIKEIRIAVLKNYREQRAGGGLSKDT